MAPGHHLDHAWEIREYRITSESPSDERPFTFEVRFVSPKKE